MAICDANYIIRFVDIGAYGRRSNDGIFKDSAIGKAFDEGRMNIPQPAAIKEGGPILPYCLVGDEAFPLKSYLLVRIREEVDLHQNKIYTIIV